MASKKPKPATAGEKIATWLNSWHPAAFGTLMLKIKLRRKIDRAIARAVRKERERCDAEWRAYVVKMRKDGEP